MKSGLLLALARGGDVFGVEPLRNAWEVIADRMVAALVGITVVLLLWSAWCVLCQAVIRRWEPGGTDIPSRSDDLALVLGLLGIALAAVIGMSLTVRAGG